jgi:hypothetical protein
MRAISDPKRDPSPTPPSQQHQFQVRATTLLWRSLKYEEVYLRAYETVAEARRLIGRYLGFFNTA